MAQPIKTPATDTWVSVSTVSEGSDANHANRRTMEDVHMSFDNYAGMPGQGMFAVFDGHGGREIVDFLEENFAAKLSTNLQKAKKKDVCQTLIQTFQEVDQMSSGIQGSGSTAAVCIIRPVKKKRMLYMANCGDTRVVLCTKGKPERLSIDHTASEPGEIKRIENAGGFILRNRILGMLSVARGFGDHTMKKYIIPVPHTVSRAVTPQDEYLIIACDGVWDVFEDEEAVNFINDGLENKKFQPHEAANRLVDMAKQRGTQDNITALVIFF